MTPDLEKLEALAKAAKATSAIDNHFYYAAREAVPALIARVRELEAVLCEITEANENDALEAGDTYPSLATKWCTEKARRILKGG